MNRSTLLESPELRAFNPGPAAMPARMRAGVAGELEGLWRLVSSRLPRPWMWTSIIVLAMSLNLGAQTLSPILMGEILDTLAMMGSRPLSESLLLLTLTVLTQIALAGGLSYVIASREALIGSRLRAEVGMAILSRGKTGQPIDVGDATLRVLSDSQKVQASFGGLFLQPAIDALGLVIAAWVMIAIHPLLGLLTLCIAPCSMLAIRKLSRELQANSAAMQVSMGSMAGIVQSWLVRANWVAVFGLFGAAGKRFANRSSSVCDVATQAASLQARIAVASVVVGALPQLAILGIGGYQVRAAELTVGGLVALMGLSALVAPSLNRLVAAMASVLPTVLPSYRRLCEVLAAADLREVEHEPDLAARELHVERLDVGKVDGPGRLIFVPRFSARRGEIVCIAGANGSGKSAFSTALLGLRPSSGQVQVTGSEGARPLRLADLAFAPSEPVVFEGSLLDNVLAFRPDRNGARDLLDWGTSGKPETTIAFDGAVTLSRGELQKLCVARALVMERPVTILDEPTTGMDDASVEALFRFLSARRQHGAVVVVTHDAKLRGLADRVYETVLRQDEWCLVETTAAPPAAPAGHG